MKKKKQEKTYSVRLVGGLVAVSLIVTLSIASFVSAQSSGISIKEIIGQVAGTILGNSLSEQLQEEQSQESMLGGGTRTRYDFTVDGETNLNATTTIDYIYHPIRVELDFAKATSTASGETTIILGSDRYNGPPLLCSLSGTGSVLNVDGLIPYTSSYSASTSTCTTAASATCGDGSASFSATSSDGLIGATELATSTDPGYPYNGDDNEGYTREVFELTDNMWIFVKSDFSTSPFSTSTMPTAASQGLTATGYYYLDCWLK